MKRLVYIIMLLILAICFVSCRTQYIPVESVRTEYKTRDSIRYDSIYQRDSIYTLVKGDTVYQYRYKYLYRYLTTNRTDTILKNDSIRVPCYFSRTGDNALFIPLRMGGCVVQRHNLFLFICNKKTPQRLKLRGWCQIRILTEFKRCLMNHFAYVLQGI